MARSSRSSSDVSVFNTAPSISFERKGWMYWLKPEWCSQAWTSATVSRVGCGGLSEEELVALVC